MSRPHVRRVLRLLFVTASLVFAKVALGAPQHEFEVPLRSDKELLQRVFPERSSRPRACTGQHGGALARCLLRRRYDRDEDARKLASLLFERMRVVTGPETHWVLNDGDFRGRVSLVPALPIGENARHLMFLNAALEEFSAFFTALARQAANPIRFAFRGIPVKFYRSLRATTPSAYVDDGVIAYNVDGELFVSYASARDTLFHELFHVNDIRHERWSQRTLTSIYEDILQACANDPACFDVHAPYETKVDEGVYYAFHPTSNVLEYSAELAIRYYREQSVALRGAPVRDAFKCKSPRNHVAWQLLVQEFFGGVDRVPAC